MQHSRYTASCATKSTNSASTGTGTSSTYGLTESARSAKPQSSEGRAGAEGETGGDGEGGGGCKHQLRGGGEVRLAPCW